MTTSEEIMDLVNSILGEEIDEDLFYSLVNIAKDRREDKREWMFLRKLNSSNTSTTSAITLPSDFKIERKIRVGSTTYYPIPLEEKEIYQNTSGYYAVDFVNNLLYLIGAPSGQTVYIYYVRVSPTITSSVTPVWPARFWPLLAFDVAGYDQSGLDADDVYARMSTENKTEAYKTEQSLESWDTNIQLKQQGDRTGIADSEPTFDIGMM